MYFGSSDACEMSVTWALQREHPKAWKEVLGALHALTATDAYDHYVTSEGDFEGALIEALAECVLYNSEEEPPSYEWRYGEVDPDWDWEGREYDDVDGVA